MSTNPPQTSEYPGAAPSPKITRGHSCVLCQQRKVKCDRQKPCSNCIKARAECITATPSLPRRKRRKLTDIDLAARLRKYEHLLKTHGVKIEDDDASQGPDETPPGNTSSAGGGDPELRLLSLNTPRPQNLERGALFTDKENSHYVENPLWEGLGREDFQYPKNALQSGSSDDESNDGALYPSPENLLVGHGSGFKSLTSMHPPAVHIFRLWQTYLVNVNPLVKIFHAPTVQQTILDASGDLERVSRPTETLMFAIYFLAVTSMSDADCQSILREPRQALLSKYCHATQQALINSKFLKSLNISTLQALALYTLGVRRIYDPHSIWILTGVAVRIAQRLGLHRDGSKYKMSPFDAEMRRRLWWEIMFLDGHAGKLTGAGFPPWHNLIDTKVPLNISDSDLSPAMKELPTEKEGATEMIFCSLRYDVAMAIKNARTFEKNAGGKVNWVMPIGLQHLQAKDKAIDELEAKIAQKYVRYCDPSIPLHLLTLHVARSVVCTMRIMAHHPRQYPDKGASIPQSEKDFLFEQCLNELEIHGLSHTIKSVEGFRWHIQDHFQMDAFIYLLSELRYRMTGDLVERAWQQVAVAYEYRPEMITNTKHALFFGVGNLTLKAWSKRESSGVFNQGGYKSSTPQYITLLRARRNFPEPPRQPTEFRHQESFMRSNGTTDFPSNLVPKSNTDQSMVDQWATTDLTFDLTMPEITPVDWDYWNTLMDGDLPAYTGNAEMEQSW